MIKVAIIEDNDQFRTALETIVNEEQDTTLAGSYTSAEKALIGLIVKFIIKVMIVRLVQKGN